nr:retrovirus-related Pol polyprotein from transposon TNT 1-94 [Tanacetum cinerariifolium]
DLKAKLQDKGIVISELKKLIEKMKGKSVDTKFEKSSVIRQPNAFKSQRPSVLGKPTTFSNSFIRKDFSKSTSTLNVKSVSAMCDKRVLIEKHDMCVLKSVAKPLKKTVVSESNKKTRNNVRKIYECVSKTYSWWYSKFTPSGYIWKPKSGTEHGNDLLTGSCGTDLYSITLQSTNSPNLIFLMAKATSSQAWLWHRRLSHLNFDTINLLSKNDIVVGLPKLKFIKDHLCSSCELGKAKRKSFHTKLTPSSKRRLHLLHMDLCGPMRVASINGKRYVLVIVDDYSKYTWTHFLRDGENLDKMKEKGDECIFVGYSNQSRAYIVFNKRTRVIMESIHVNFDELPQMVSAHIGSDPVPACQTMASVQISSDPEPEFTTSNELDLLFSPMFDELLNGSSKVVSKSSVVSAADVQTQRQ